MAETAYPYATHLDIKFDPLTLIDVSSLAKTATDQWYNQTLCEVNDSVIRLGVMQGEYHWHKHDNDDEFFFVLSGRFIIDLEGHSIELLPNQGFTVPKGVLHCTRARERSVILMVDRRNRAHWRYLIEPAQVRSLLRLPPQGAISAPGLSGHAGRCICANQAGTAQKVFRRGTIWPRAQQRNRRLSQPMQGRGRTSEAPLLTTDSIPTYSSGGASGYQVRI